MSLKSAAAAAAKTWKLNRHTRHLTAKKKPNTNSAIISAIQLRQYKPVESE